MAQGITPGATLPAVQPGAQPNAAANPAATVNAILAQNPALASNPQVAALLNQVNGGGAATTNPAAATQPGATGAATLTPQNSTLALNTLLGTNIQVPPTALGDRTRPISAIFDDLGKISNARQQRLKDIYIAIAADAQATGSYNQLALQRVQRETTVEEQSSTLMRSVFDKLNNAIQAWIQR